ncbi:MAG TPA: LLM class flavin-dependent oxidoreductase [Dehalococcoidia bacterium]|nr:LLM class flavin-dependent oxidoreductase [Dehalococcoidia bacterium]
MALPRRMKFGIFMAPFHRLGENPTLALQRDLELLQLLDRLDYDEAWIGEHHSAGWEIIASPEVFIAHALAQTRHIRLGTGVVSLPYHNPYMVADRMVLLDHLSRGRAMLGVGPGALPSDAYQLRLNPLRQRPQMDEALGLILRLLHGEAVTYQSDWIDLREARLQLAPYSDPLFPVAVASTLSPSGPATAGKHGVGLISLSTFMPMGTTVADQWRIAEQAAAEHGQTIHRRDWRLMLPIYLAETREEAYRDVSLGAYAFQKEYFDQTLGRPLQYDGPPEAFAETMASVGGAIIGTPDEAVAAIKRLQELSGGFGGLLGLAHEWAPTAKIHRSFELLARYVAPQFQGALEPLAAAQHWSHENRTMLNANEVGGVVGAFKALNQPVPNVVHGVTPPDAGGQA